MLVLTRKSGQGIWIGDDVHVQILELRDGQVKIGIRAPQTKSVHRDEVYDRIRRLNILASSVQEKDLDEL
jgi:carbon storage regulator